jgi:Coenzyme PQQ synthesis protein D (PqqD)
MRVEISEDVVWRDLDDEVVILDIVSNQYFGLNGAGGAMWRLLAGHGSVDEIVARLAEQFDAGAEQLRTDLEALIKDLEGKGLLKITAEASSTTKKRTARR